PNAAVHLLASNRQPVPLDPDLGVLVRRRIEVLRKRSVHVGRDELAIALSDGNGAVLSDLVENTLELLLVIGFDHQPRIARIDSPMADPPLADLAPTPQPGDLVEALRQQLPADGG